LTNIGPSAWDTPAARYRSHLRAGCPLCVVIGKRRQRRGLRVDFQERCGPEIEVWPAPRVGKVDALEQQRELGRIEFERVLPKLRRRTGSAFSCDLKHGSQMVERDRGRDLDADAVGQHDGEHRSGRELRGSAKLDLQERGRGQPPTPSFEAIERHAVKPCRLARSRQLCSNRSRTS
jgi:hypothetical protein